MVSQLTEDQIAEIKEAFSLFDNGNGTITENELGPVMRCLGLKPTTVELHGILSMVDTKGLQIFDFSEFLSLIARKWRLVEGIKHFDPDGSGYVTLLDLDHALRHLGEVLDEENLLECISKGFDAGMVRGCEKCSRDAFEVFLREEVIPQVKAARADECAKPMQTCEQPEEAVEPPLALRVEVLKLSGETVASITMDSVAKIGSLQQEVARRIGVPVERQSLLYEGSTLPPQATLVEAGILDGAVINLVLRADVLVEYAAFVGIMHPLRYWVAGTS